MENQNTHSFFCRAIVKQRCVLFLWSSDNELWFVTCINFTVSGHELFIQITQSNILCLIQKKTTQYISNIFNIFIG